MEAKATPLLSSLFCRGDNLGKREVDNASACPPHQEPINSIHDHHDNNALDNGAIRGYIIFKQTVGSCGEKAMIPTASSDIRLS